MARPGVFGVPSEESGKLERLAILARDEKALASMRVTPSGPVLRLAMAGLAGIFLLMAGKGAGWAWIGACFYMLSIAGAPSSLGAAAGAITGGIAYFRVTGSREIDGVFWALAFFHALGGCMAGVLGAEISRKLPPPAFAFLAALLPAGLEQLGAFSGAGNLTSTALTQYAYPAIVRMARLGGMAGVTYVIFVFGGAVASAVRYVRDVEVVLPSALAPLGLVILGLMYGGISGSATEKRVLVGSFSPNARAGQAERLYATGGYDEQGWTKYIESTTAAMRAICERPLATTGLSRREEGRGLDVFVWPEASVAVNAKTKELFLTRLASTSKITRCVQAAAYYDVDLQMSECVVVGRDGEPAGTFARRRYVEKLDDVFFPDQIAVAVEDEPEAVETAAGKFGAILSYDGNFFSNFKSIAGSGGQLVCVSGLDDEKVPGTSERILVYNAALSGMAVVRSARNGLLMAISPDGRIVESKRTPEKADARLQGTVALGDGSSPFLTIGNLFAWLALLGGIGAGLYATTLEGRGRSGRSGLVKREDSGGLITYRSGDGMKGV